MTTNFRVQKVCINCKKEFTAQKTTTKYCCQVCAARDYKKRVKEEKIAATNNETKRIKSNPIEDLKAKEFLTVKNVAVLLNCSIRTIYRLIEDGTINAVNISERKTTIKRSDIDKLFEQPKIPMEVKVEPIQYDISDCYNLLEIVN